MKTKRKVCVAIWSTIAAKGVVVKGNASLRDDLVKAFVDVLGVCKTCTVDTQISRYVRFDGDYAAYLAHKAMLPSS